MKNKVQKKEELKMLEEKFPKTKMSIFTTFARGGEKGLSVAQSQELKRALRSVGSEYLVTKKSLIEIALRDLKYDGLDVYSMQGSVGVILGNEDTYAIAKKLHEFAKKNPALKFFGGFADGVFLSKEMIVEMALMPSREASLARLFGMMKYPITSLAMVMKQIADKQSEGTPVVEAAPEASTNPEATE